MKPDTSAGSMVWATVQLQVGVSAAWSLQKHGELADSGMGELAWEAWVQSKLAVGCVERWLGGSVSKASRGEEKTTAWAVWKR